MTEEIIVEPNLLYLKNVLLSLEKFCFDKEITFLLKELNSLVDCKLYSDRKKINDIIDMKYKIIFYYKN